ncbi:MAG: hypothetical protein HKN08_12135 [Gammaproteobacteria bacterium]|nr:hypothetical protein [Gammaproteobacteria bacterium]
MVNQLFFNTKCTTAILICLMTGILYGCIQGDDPEEIHVMAKNTSNAMNSNLPDMVNQDMLLLETDYEEMVFSYYVSVLNYSFNSVDIGSFMEYMRPNLIENVCTLDRHQIFINKDISIRYVYSDKNQVEFTEIIVHPTDCR